MATGMFREPHKNISLVWSCIYLGRKYVVAHRHGAWITLAFYDADGVSFDQQGTEVDDAMFDTATHWMPV